jgi:hypothetical protein
MFNPIEVHKIDLLYDLKVGINKHDNDYIADYNEKIKEFYKFFKKSDYTFDGVYFESIEKIGSFQPIVNLKNAKKEENKTKEE